MDDRSRVLEILGSGIPLSLLMDLACADGPDSRAIATYERRTA